MNHRSKRSNERGSILIVAFLFAIISVGYASTLIMTGFAVSTESRAHSEAGRAKEAAESGVHHAVAHLNATPELAHASFWQKKEAAGDPTVQLAGLVRGDAKSANAQRYAVTIAWAGKDGADNDLDGNIDEEDEEKVFEIRSVGSIGSASKTIRVTAFHEPIILPSAVYLEDDTPNMTLGGTFTFNGRDQGLSGGFTGLEAPGFGTTGDPQGLIDGLKQSQYNKITGEGSSPSIREVEQFDDVDLIIERALDPGADTIYLGEYPDGHYGTKDDPKIVATSKDFTISGSFHGFGLLIISAGDLAMSGGSIKWTGLVIVISDGNNSIDNGSINIQGGIMFAGADFQDDDEEDMGSFNVQYSTEAMNLATGPLGIGRMKVFNWRAAVASAPAVP